VPAASSFFGQVQTLFTLISSRAPGTVLFLFLGFEESRARRGIHVLPDFSRFFSFETPELPRVVSPPCPRIPVKVFTDYTRSPVHQSGTIRTLIMDVYFPPGDPNLIRPTFFIPRLCLNFLTFLLRERVLFSRASGLHAVGNEF